MNKLLNSRTLLVPLLRFNNKLRLHTSSILTSILLVNQQQQQQLLKRNNNIIICYYNKLNKMNTSSTSNTSFIGKEDRYNGIIVDSTSEPCKDIQQFYTKLTESLNEWNKKNKRCIWFKVNIEDSEWIPILTQNGFKFHHAKQTYLMLYRWLPSLELSNIPPYAHTMLGVGALVINEQTQQLLIVQEKYFIGQEPMWKLPGGYVEPGEDLIAAAIREVKEETNIECEFKSLITIRHTHHVMFECSDLYFVILLNINNNKSINNNIIKCQRELLDCKWINIHDYLLLTNVSDLNKSFVQQYLLLKQNNIIINQTNHIHSILNKPYQLFNIQFNN